MGQLYLALVSNSYSQGGVACQRKLPPVSQPRKGKPGSGALALPG